MMNQWDSRMHNTQSVQMLKVAIPFFDVPVGEKIDLEGVFGAIRPFAGRKERKLIDIVLQFFSMRHMMEMMQIMQTMQEMQKSGDREAGKEDKSFAGGMAPMEFIRSMVPPEQQDMVEMMFSMMSEETEQAGKEKENESVDF